MNSKVRFIPLIVLGAIILSLIAVIPAFSDTGKLRFYDVTDTDEDQEWARSGGMVYLEVDDSDLDVPVKYVILPSELEMVGPVTGMTGSMVTVMATSTADIVVGDTVLVEGNTIREVTAVSSDGDTLTLNRPVADGSSGNLYEVMDPNGTGKLDVEDCEACAAAQMEPVTEEGYIVLANAPVADSGVGHNLGNRFGGATDSRVNSRDVRLVDMEGNDHALQGHIQQVNNNEDRVEVPAPTADQMVYVVYWGSSENDTGSTVDVRSSADSEGITVVLAETGPSTGVFQGMITLTAEDSDEAMGLLRVNPSGSVTLRYDDDGTRRTKAIDVETTRPVLSNFSPAHNSASQNDRPEVMFDVTDSDSGIADSDVFVVFSVLDDNEVMGGGMKARSVSVDEDGRLRDITDGVRGEQRLADELRVTSGDSMVAWWVVTKDKAGNSAVSDQNTDSDSPCNADDFPGLSTILTGDYDDDPVEVDDLSGEDVGDDFTSGCQPFIVKVDDTDPTLLRATTGSFWDAGSDDDDKTNSDRTAAKPTSIRLDFDEALSGDSVSADDFEVDGKAPLDAAHYSGAAMSVFLTVPALDPHDKPVVELVGEVEDPAGNTANSGTTGDDDGGPTHDGIAPTVTVTLEGVTSGDRPVTDSEIKITVETDENTLNPQVTITRVASATSDGEGLLGDDVEMRTPKVKSPRVYETSWSTSTAGLYNVFVTADDGSGEGEAGVSGDMMMVDHDDDEDTADVSAYSPVDLSSDTKALLFEVDNSGPEFALNP